MKDFKNTKIFIHWALSCSSSYYIAKVKQVKIVSQEKYEKWAQQTIKIV